MQATVRRAGYDITRGERAMTMAQGGRNGTREAARTGLGATMADVAAIAGVTKMTVSRALRHPELVRTDTLERVRRVMGELGYVPNRLAGSLTAGRTGLVAAIVPTLRHSLFADTIEGMSDVLAEAELDLIVASSRYRADVEESQIRTLLERRPDAIVLTGLTHTPEARELLRSAGIPVVETWESTDEPIDMAVGFSNREAAAAMTATLIASGYRRIAFVNGPSEANERARHRAEGYAAAMAAAGLEPRPIEVVRHLGAIRVETGGRVLARLMQGRDRPDAVFFTSDVFAVGAILECRRLGIAVPGAVGIAGFHDLEMGRLVSPTLTTVHVPALEIGRRAGEVILARLADGGARAPEELPFRIIRRQSTRRRPRRAGMVAAAAGD
jgi:LacI family gluconate utilization system Gnt-I transcriptional repressor